MTTPTRPMTGEATGEGRRVTGQELQQTCSSAEQREIAGHPAAQAHWCRYALDLRDALASNAILSATLAAKDEEIARVTAERDEARASFDLVAGDAQEAWARAASKDQSAFELFTACSQIAEVFGFEMPLHPADIEENLAAKVRAAKFGADRDLTAANARIAELEVALRQPGGQVTETMVEVCAEAAWNGDGTLKWSDDENTGPYRNLWRRRIRMGLVAALAASPPVQDAGTGNQIR